MFERFTKDARDAVVGAQEHARGEGSRSIGVRHLWLALCGSPLGGTLASAGVTPDAMADTAPSEVSDADALRSLGIDLESVRRAAEANFGEGALDRELGGRRRWFRRSARRGGHIPFTDEAKKALELSLREAIRLDSGYIGLEHLALGALRGSPSAVPVADRAALRAVLESRVRRSA